MEIAVHAAELDEARIDGTRVYLSELLRRLDDPASGDTWHLYHRRAWNPLLCPPPRNGYREHLLPGTYHWTQTRFTWAARKLRPATVFMPIQVLPYGLPQTARTVVTIHDLAFKYYPETFPSRDARRLSWFTDEAVRRADRLIAVTEATKRDLLRSYAGLDEEKIRVIRHGFDPARFDPEPGPEDGRILRGYGLVSRRYALFVGAIQPRKNIGGLLDAFARVRERIPEMRLVIVGARAWLWQGIERAVSEHRFRDDIVMAGAVRPEDLPVFYRHARMFVYPSFYEGFGLPILEAMACGTPVITSDNSSLPEVGGDAALYVDPRDADVLAERMEKLWTDDVFAETLRTRGFSRTRDFSWDAAARETRDWITR